MNKKTIFLEAEGRLGNQLFQYAFARSIKTKYKFDKICIYFKEGNQLNSFCKDFEEITEDEYLANLNKIQKMIHRIGYSDRKLFKHSFLSFSNNKRHARFLRNFMYEKLGLIDYYDSIHLFNFKIPKYIRTLCIHGFFENKYYFKEIEDDIYEEIHKNMVENIGDGFLLRNYNSSENSVCVSVRRGDFVTNPFIKESKYICDSQYFAKAINILNNNINNPVIIVFSDDIKFCKNAFNIYENIYFEPEGLTLLEKVFYMCSCKHFVLSNSTFSWWVWFLSEKNNEQIVIAPISWRKNIPLNSLNEENWIKI